MVAPRLQVLVIDDEQALAELIAEELSDWGMDVETASNGRAGFDKIQNKNYQIILSDIRMPDGDGLELLANVRSAGLTVPVLLMSGFHDLDAEESVALGAVGLLDKPVDPELLIATIETCLGVKLALVD